MVTVVQEQNITKTPHTVTVNNPKQNVPLTKITRENAQLVIAQNNRSELDPNIRVNLTDIVNVVNGVNESHAKVLSDNINSLKSHGANGNPTEAGKNLRAIRDIASQYGFWDDIRVEASKYSIQANINGINTRLNEAERLLNSNNNQPTREQLITAVQRIQGAQDSRNILNSLSYPGTFEEGIKQLNVPNDRFLETSYTNSVGEKVRIKRYQFSPEELNRGSQLINRVNSLLKNERFSGLENSVLIPKALVNKSLEK
jgi:hypothetical protein